MYLIPVQHLRLAAEGIGHSHIHIAVPGIPGRCQRGIVAADGRRLVTSQGVQVQFRGKTGYGLIHLGPDLIHVKGGALCLRHNGISLTAHIV